MIDLTTLIVGGTTLVTGICLASFGNARGPAGRESLPGSQTGLRIDRAIAFVLILFTGGCPRNNECAAAGEQNEHERDGAFVVPRTAPGGRHL